MAFRKIHIKVTQESLLDVLKDVKQVFFDSDAPEYLKVLLKRIDINFFIVKRPRWKIYGLAWLISKNAKRDLAKKCLKLNVKANPSITIDGTIYFPIIEINKGAWQRITYRGLKHLVAHELAHILQIVLDHEVNGVYSYQTDHDHDHRWQRFSRLMGGTGEELIPFEELWC